LFTEEGTVRVYLGGPSTTETVQSLRGRADLAEAFMVLDRYKHTTHLNGQCTIQLEGDRATGESYCLAHHVWVQDGQRTLMVMSIRYLDTFIRVGGRWSLTGN
jgi:hypothetical protein